MGLALGRGKNDGREAPSYSTQCLKTMALAATAAKEAQRLGTFRRQGSIYYRCDVLKRRMS
jgi:hypothetical protein